MGRHLNYAFGYGEEEPDYKADNFTFEEKKHDFEVHPKIERIKQSKKYDDDINTINPFEQYNEHKSFGLKEYSRSQVGPIKKRKNLNN